MGTISSGIGLISGIDSANIVEQLIQLERRPIIKLQSRIQQTSEIQLIFTELSTRLAKLRASGSQLRRPSTFQQVNARSSNEGLLTATARSGAAEGSYTFRVARTVSTQQLVSNGLATADATPVGAGTITLELGNARLDREVALEELNGGTGVRRGVIELTDRLGRIARVDLRDAITLDDVVDRINSASGSGIRASVDADRVVLNDSSGGTGNMRVRDVSGQAAEDLGLIADVAADTVTGKGLVYLSAQTALADLREGGGVANRPGDGLRVKLRDDSTFDLSTAGMQTLGEVIDAFNLAADGKATMSIDPADARRLVVNDSSFGGGDPARTLRIEGLNGSAAAAQLGLAGEVGGTTLQGSRLLASAGSVLLSALEGGSGLDGGRIRITSSTGTTTDIDLRGAVDVQGLLDRVNDADAGARARINSAGTGIELFDTAGGAGPLTVEDLSGDTFAARVGWLGTHDDGRATGSNLQRAWMTGNTSLSTLNGGRGVGLGKVRITDSTGAAHTFNFSNTTVRTVQDVLNVFNSTSPVSLQARINDNGDGILIEDTAGGGVVFKVEDVEGSLARDLRLAGEHEEGKVDGSFEVTIEVGPDATLQDVRDRINELGFAARAQIINAGGSNPYRLSLVGRNGGQLGGFVFDAGDTRLSMTTMGRARDAAVFLGGDGAESPLLVTSGTNVIRDVVPGLTLDLQRADSEPVTVSIDRDVDSITAEFKTFIEGFNDLREAIDKNSRFNEETGKRGVLLGEPAVQRIERQIYGLVDRVFDSGNPRFRIMADFGVRVGDGAKLEFNEERFLAAWSEDPQAVERFFTTMETGFGHVLQEAVTRLTDPVDGVIARTTQNLERRSRDFQEQIDRMEVLVQGKKRRLQKEFLDLELALASLQNQQDALAGMQKFDYAAFARPRN